MWKKFIDIFMEVLNESENLFTYSSHEKLLAQIRGEKLFWSGTLRKGMIRTLIMKGFYKKKEDCQLAMDEVVNNILNCINTEKQWSYISTFWAELCEISPKAVLARLDRDLEESTGLMGLFENQDSDFLFGRNAYIEILWGVEQFLVQKEFAWDGLRWLLKLDSRNYVYTSNAPKDAIAKAFCTWHNFSAIRTPEEKIITAESTIKSNSNVWTYLYEAIPHHGGSMLGELSTPKYRDYIRIEPVTAEDIWKVSTGYIKILLDNMDFSVERWSKMLKATDDFNMQLKRNVFDRLLYEITQMNDYEIISIKNNIRELIYRHRFFAASSWAMPEEQLQEYEHLLGEIHTNWVEYEYGYLFSGNRKYPLLHPVPYETEGEKESNDFATEKLIRESLFEFQSKNYRLDVLAEFSGKEQRSSLGHYLARYWKGGRWDFETFQILLKAQSSGTMAVDYMSIVIGKEVSLYPDIISKVIHLGYSEEILSKIYHSEAFWTEKLPLISNASEKMKKLFWKSSVSCQKRNARWAVNESKMYSTLDIFLEHLYYFHHENRLSAGEIFSYMEGIERMDHAQDGQMTNYYMEKLIGIIQKEFLYDDEKCWRIAQIEIIFMHRLEWENMKCFRHMIKKSPELFAQLVAGLYKKDHEAKEVCKPDEQYVHNMYTMYDKAHFCPAEENGEVQEEKLRQWVEKFRILLEQNDQSSLFGAMLGRLFSFSPVGKDGHKPCEAVRTLIEDYCDDRMRSSYETAVYNARGIHSPTAGREERRMAEAFKANAQYLKPRYPETAKIYYSLNDRYIREAERERMEAENGRY